MRYFIFTLGCQMNKSDSERIAAVFEHVNWSAGDEKDADLIVVNACSVRQTAIDRIWGKLKLWNKWKKKRLLKIVLTGCVLPNDMKAFQGRFDFIFNINELDNFSKFLGCDLDYVDYFNIQPLSGAPTSSAPYVALAPIMTGCNNFCAYCAVPYVRGREKSRLAKEILAEIETLVGQGKKHVILLGQNVNSYCAPEQIFCSSDNKCTHDFAKLLWEVNKIDGITRLEFSSSHPKDLHDEVIELLALPKMMNYLHLPLQAGDNEILEKMNRKYTVEDYLKLIEKIRASRPSIHIGTDVIVGFPGETEEQFENTYKFFEEVGFDNAYISKYSPRPNSAAALLNDDVSKEEKSRRWNKLHELFKKFVQARNESFVGKNVEVLVMKKTEDCWEGESREKKKVRFAADVGVDLLGKEVVVNITKALAWGLCGKKIA
ncbi:tRNA (N6-isopentenyl adenosine(37)-C2)-methylthiotransferase MiaB [Candidatus Falkowbacteria bacterium]|nr:tRNA (N6-isopentenyl adenosine(37)-C2)-methylthiotransferase MiaB [Candidatus Falkowbacteria bacterium]